MLRRWSRDGGWQSGGSSRRGSKQASSGAGDQAGGKPSGPLASSVRQNMETFRTVISGATDVVVRPFLLGPDGRVRCALLYIDGLVDKSLVSEHGLKSLLLDLYPVKGLHGEDPAELYDRIKERALTISEVREADSWEDLLFNVLSGEAVILVDGCSTALVMCVRSFNARGVEEPQTEAAVRGPREGFNEVLRTNTALIRRKLRTPDLRMENLTLGTRTKTDVVVLYVEGLARPELVDEVLRRLRRIDIDGVLDTSYLEEFIEDAPLSLFPTVNRTERPDKVVAQLLEGRVAILVDGTPFAITVPAFFWEFLQVPDDYYERAYVATFLRVLRVLVLGLALTLPSLYVAVTTYHPEMIPTPLALSIAAGREAVPLPAFLEAFLMEVAFEIIREAGVRLPRVVGQAVSIVGVLVIGQAAVSGGVVSPIIIIVVGGTAIANLAIPNVGAAVALRLLRFPMIFLAATLGLFGIVFGLVFLLLHLASLRSFGVPYLAPVAPLGGLKDIPVRAPWWQMVRRPRMLAGEERLEPARSLRAPATGGVEEGSSP